MIFYENISEWISAKNDYFYVFFTISMQYSSSDEMPFEKDKTLDETFSFQDIIDLYIWPPDEPKRRFKRNPVRDVEWKIKYAE